MTIPTVTESVWRQFLEGRATLTVEEAGELLGIGRSNAYQSVREGSIPSIRLGKRIVVPVAALERLLEQGSGA